MPKQVQPAFSLDAQNKQVNIEVGGQGFVVTTAELLTRNLIDETIVRNNLAMAFQIGGFTEPADIQFRNFVNGLNQGIDTAFGRCKINTVELDDEAAQRYLFTMRITTGQFKNQEFGVGIIKPFLLAEVETQALLKANIASAIRIDGFNTIKTLAITNLNNRKFWIST